jgi:predicted enzyme related to lactoylglutathione lyase
MAVSLFAVVVDSHEPERLARFWGAALGWQTSRRNEGEFQTSDSEDGKVSLYFMAVPEPKKGKNRMHLDVITEGSMEDEVRRLVDLGARVVEARQDPASFDNRDTWTVMTDPEGNEFCVTSTATLTGWA